MHPLALLVLVANCAGTIHALPAAAGTPAAHFWAEALPGTPMPEAIADLVQKGIDHPPLMERYKVVPDNSGDGVDGPGITLVWGCVSGCPDKSEVPPGLIFHKEQVRVGSIMTVALPPEAPPAILPQAVSEKIPFGNLSDVLAMFDIAPNSMEAATVADILRRCHDTGGPAGDGERKSCTTSLESTVKSAIDMLGASRASVLASELPSWGGLPLQQYQVQAVSPVHSDRYVGCHVMHYPYAVYYCHTRTTGLPRDEAYVISLRGLSSNGPAIAMAAICHLDTSKWSPANPVFEILHTHPGIPVCHFLQYASLLFVDKTANA